MTDPQDISVTVSHCTISIIARSDSQNQKHKLFYAQIHTHSYAISCLTRKSVLHTHKSLRAHKSLSFQSSTITYAISHLRAKDVHRMHNSPQAHKSYTYAISRLRAKVVFYTQSRVQGTKAVQPAYADYYKQFLQIKKIFQRK